MKALTIQQPWASLIIHGLKVFETRSWSTKYSGALAIHAGKTFALAHSPELTEALGQIGKTHPGPLPLGCVLGIVNLENCFTAEFVMALAKEKHPELKNPDREIALGFYAPGRWAWKLQHPKPFATPVPAKGKLGLWNWEIPA